jgi:hypothetical protein
MKIPVFVSSPTSLSPSQEAARTVIIRQLDDNDLEARALGRSDHPTELPLREGLLIARHCSGGIILGFEQFGENGGLKKRGTPAEEQASTSIPFPTSWNVFGVRHSFRASPTDFSILAFSAADAWRLVFSLMVCAFAPWGDFDFLFRHA